MAARGDREGSESGSEHSNSQHSKRSFKKGSTGKNDGAAAKEFERPVSKLRPKAPTTASASNTIYEVASKMTSNRVDAALLLDDGGVLAGIITDNDITRRVVAQFVDANEAKVDSVMTKNPKCVRSEDSALDALEMMVDNHFRHLPVLDKDGAVVGLLDIAKCLYDAISILEKVQAKEENDSSNAGTGAVLAEVMTAAMKNMGGSRGSNAAQLLAMKALMENMFGGSLPTLRTILLNSKASFPSVRQSVNIREAAVSMTKFRKGLLVEDQDGEIVGIITPKDVLTRVLAQNKSPDVTAVFSVMTPNPDFVSPDLSLLDALKEMHDHKYLHLPVREEDGRVVGLVDVMDLISHTAGGDGAGGGKGWRDFFRGAMAARGDREGSETASSHISEIEVIKPMAPAPIKTRYQLQQQQMQVDTSSDVFSISNDLKFPNSVTSKSYDLHSSANEEVNFKVTDEDGNIHKIKLVPNSNTIDLLKDMVAEKLSLQKEQLVIKYIDEENDEVLLNSNKLLEEAIVLAKRSNATSVRLIVRGVKKVNEISSVSAPSDSVKGSAESKKVAEKPTDPVKEGSDAVVKAEKSGGGSSFLLYGAGAVIVTGIAVAAFVFTRQKK